MDEAIEKIDKLLKDNGIYADVYHNNKFPSCTVTVFIEGDWKHDHMFAKHLLSTIGYSEVREDIVGNSDDDFYKSEHTFMYASEDTVNALKEMFKSKQ